MSLRASRALATILALLTGAWVVGIFAVNMAPNTAPSELSPWSFVNVSSLILVVTLPGIGWLVASRRPENRIGWMLLAIGSLVAFGGFSVTYAEHGLVTDPGSLPLADVMSWLKLMTWQPGFVLLILLLLVFPDGRLPSRRWAPVVWIAGIALVLMVVPQAIAFWRYRGPLLVPFDVATPASDQAPAIAGLLQGVGLILCLVVATAGAAAGIVRFRRSAGAEHQQIKWFASAAAVEFAVIFVMSAPPPTVVPPPFDALLAIVVGPLIPIAIGIAILRYRLYDIDRIISRTVSYGAVTAILAVVFVGTILVAQTVLASFFRGSSVAVAASTLVVVALFQPLRRRVQAVVDRRFNRARYDAERTVAAFGLQLRDQVDLKGLGADLESVVRHAVAPHQPRALGPPRQGRPMNERVLRRVAYAGAAIAIALTAAGFMCFVAISLHDGQFAIDANGTGGFVLGFTFPIVGAIVASRRPQNPIGWIYLAIGLSQGLNVFAWTYATYGLVAVPGSLPIADLMAWVGVWSWQPGFVLFATIALLIFPDGHHLSPRWRLVSAAAILCTILMMVPIAVASWPMRGTALVAMAPGTSSGGLMDIAVGIQGVALAFVGAAAVASLVSLLLRWRRARGIERAQLKWLAFAVMIEIPVLLVMSAPPPAVVPPPFDALLAIVITPLIPISIGIAILRYRLYDIDRIISRTVSYGAVTGILAAVFVGTILVSQTVLASFFRGSSVAVAASTLVVAAIFQPLRRRVQSVVDRRFNRSRYDAERTAAAFGARLRDEVDLANLIAEVRQVVAATLAPVTVGLWIREEDAGS